MANDILAREIAEDIFIRYGVEARYTEDCIILVDNPSNDLDDLKCQIQCLTAEINNLKSEILKIKSNS